MQILYLVSLIFCRQRKKLMIRLLWDLESLINHPNKNKTNCANENIYSNRSRKTFFLRAYDAIQPKCTKSTSFILCYKRKNQEVYTRQNVTHWTKMNIVRSLHRKYTSMINCSFSAINDTDYLALISKYVIMHKAYRTTKIYYRLCSSYCTTVFIEY